MNARRFRKGVLLAATIALAAPLVACGSGGEGVPTGGAFPPHITSVKPGRGSSVTNEDLFIGRTDVVDGICVGFSFQVGAGMGEAPDRLVRMFLDGQEITSALQWVMTTDFPPSQGGGCYAPPQALERGLHEVTVRYSDGAGQQFRYDWSFSVK